MKGRVKKRARSNPLTAAERRGIGGVAKRAIKSLKQAVALGSPNAKLYEGVLWGLADASRQADALKLAKALEHAAYEHAAGHKPRRHMLVSFRQSAWDDYKRRTMKRNPLTRKETAMLLRKARRLAKWSPERALGVGHAIMALKPRGRLYGVSLKADGTARMWGIKPNPALKRKRNPWRVTSPDGKQHLTFVRRVDAKEFAARLLHQLGPHQSASVKYVKKAPFAIKAMWWAPRRKRNPLLQIIGPAVQGFAMGAGAAVGARAMRAWNPRKKKRKRGNPLSRAESGRLLWWSRHVSTSARTLLKKRLIGKVDAARMQGEASEALRIARLYGKAGSKRSGVKKSRRAIQKSIRAGYPRLVRVGNPYRVVPATTALGRRVGYRVLDARGQQVYYTFRTKKAATAAARRAAKRNPTRRRNTTVRRSASRLRDIWAGVGHSARTRSPREGMKFRLSGKKSWRAIAAKLRAARGNPSRRNSEQFSGRKPYLVRFTDSRGGDHSWVRFGKTPEQARGGALGAIMADYPGGKITSVVPYFGAGERSGNPSRGRNPTIRRDLTVPEQHLLAIAKASLRMPAAMLGVMGGPSKAEAREIVKAFGKKAKKNPLSRAESGRLVGWSRHIRQSARELRKRGLIGLADDSFMRGEASEAARIARVYGKAGRKRKGVAAWRRSIRRSMAERMALRLMNPNPKRRNFVTHGLAFGAGYALASPTLAEARKAVAERVEHETRTRGRSNPKRDRRGRFVKGRKGNPLTRKEALQVVRWARAAKKTGRAWHKRGRHDLGELNRGYGAAMKTVRDVFGPKRGRRAKKNPLTRTETALVLKKAREHDREARRAKSDPAYYHHEGATRMALWIAHRLGASRRGRAGWSTRPAQNPLTRKETAEVLRTSRRRFALAKHWRKSGDAAWAERAIGRGRELRLVAARYGVGRWARGSGAAELVGTNPRRSTTKDRGRPGQKILGSKIIPWAQAKKAKGFAAAMKAYGRFHGAAPAHATVVRVADGSKKVTRRTVFMVGEAPEISYQTIRGQKSNKAGGKGKRITWVHRCGEKGGRKPLIIHDPLSGVTSYLGGTLRLSDWMRH